VETVGEIDIFDVSKEVFIEESELFYSLFVVEGGSTRGAPDWMILPGFVGLMMMVLSAFTRGMEGDALRFDEDSILF